MGIIHTAKKYIADELLKKKVLEKQIELGRELTHRDNQQIKQQVEQEAKNMNLNQVCLCFQAFTVDSNSMWQKLCNPVYSNPINNMSKYSAILENLLSIFEHQFLIYSVILISSF